MAGPLKVSFLRGVEVAAGVTAFMLFENGPLQGAWSPVAAPVAALVAAGFVHLADAWIMPKTLG